MARTSFSPTHPMFPADAGAVTPSDTVNLAQPSVIYAGGGGAIRVLTAQGSTVTFSSLQPGSIIPLQVVRVYATGTTAVNIVAIF